MSMKEIARWSADGKAPDMVVDILTRWEGQCHVADEIRKHVFKFNYDGKEPVCNCPLCDFTNVDSVL